MAATIQVPANFTATDRFSHVVRGMGKSVKKWSKSSIGYVKRFDSRINRTFSKLGKIGALVGGIAIGTIFNAALQNNIDYGDSLASVSAITGATGDALADLEKLSLKTAKSQTMLGKDVLKAYELIGSAKPELLENSKLLDEVTNSAIILSKAGRMELEPAAEALTTTLNQFGLGGERAKDVIDNLAAGAKFGSSSISNTSDALAKFGTIAAATGTKVDEAIALVELVSPFEKGSEAGTKLRNVLGKLSGAKILPPEAQKFLKKYGVNVDLVTDKNISLSKRLKEMSKIAGDADAITKVFGETNKGLATGLFANIDGFDGMLAKIKETGVAQEQATTNSKTLRFAIDSIKTGFLNVTTATNTNNGAMKYLIDTISTLGSNMDTVVIIGASLISMWLLMKAIIIANTVVTGAYNIAMGISTAITQNNKRALIGNVAAQTAYKVAMGVGTVVTWLATAAQTAFAIAVNLGLWPILAIIAAVVAIILVIKNWSKISDWFGEKWKQFTAWISEAWQNVVKWFTDFDFKQMFMDIGQSILKFMLTPMRTMLELLSNVPGKIGELAKMGLDKIGSITGDVSVTPEGGEVLPSTSQASNSNVSRSIQEKNSNVTLDIRDKGNNVGNVTNDDNIPINIGSTVGSF